MDYEYGLVTTTLGSKDARGRPRRLSAEVVGAELAEFSGALANSLRVLDGGGWEALSHQTVTVGDVLIVTVLIRRPEGVGGVS